MLKVWWPMFLSGRKESHAPLCFLCDRSRNMNTGKCCSSQWSRAATLPWGSGQLQDWGCLTEMGFQYFCAAHTREGGCLGRGSHHPAAFTFFSWSPSILGDLWDLQNSLSAAAQVETLTHHESFGISSEINCCWLFPKPDRLFHYYSLESISNTHKNRNLNITPRCYNVFLFPQYIIHQNSLWYYDS